MSSSTEERLKLALADIARLTRERDDARATSVERKTTIERLEQGLMIMTGRSTRAEIERDEALARLAEADAVIVTLEDGAWAYGTTEDDLAKLNEWRAEALARHAARAKGDG